MKTEHASSTHKANVQVLFFRVSTVLLVCSRSTWYVLSIPLHRIVKRKHILKGQDLIKLIIFTASSKPFKNETGFFPPASVCWWKIQWVLLQFGATALSFSRTNDEIQKVIQVLEYLSIILLVASIHMKDLLWLLVYADTRQLLTR